MSTRGDNESLDPASALFAELRGIYVDAGKPSARTIARDLGDVSHTTVAEALSGRRLPSWPVLARIVEHLGGDNENFRRMWANVEFRKQHRRTDASSHTGRSVFVVHGRDEQIRRTFFDFLRSLDLRPLEWDEVIQSAADYTPSLHGLIEAAIARAQAVVVLLTPDDVTNPHLALQSSADANDDTPIVAQPRPNVLIELGMILAKCPDRTIIVDLGNFGPKLGLTGQNLVRFDGSREAVAKVSQRLKMAGCTVDESGTDWRDTARFEDLVS